MKNTIKNLLISSLLVISILSINTTYAAQISVSSIRIVDGKELTRSQIFDFYGDIIGEYIPDSYKYINLEYRGVSNGSEDYKNLQKLVYVDALNNSTKNPYLNKEMNAYAFYLLSADVLGLNITNITSQTKEQLLKRNTYQSDINIIKKLLDGKTQPIAESPELPTENKKVEYKKQVFFDVYETILNKHYNKSELDEEEIIDKAIQGLTEGTNDRHTTYFPPVESQSFSDGLSGEYEGIGAYVDMKKPGVLEVLTPIAGSPSEKAGLRGGDIVIKVDNKEVTEKNSLSEVVTWIKGPAGTDVVLTIVRDNNTREITVTRAKIIIKDIEYEKISSNTAYVSMKSFGAKSGTEFKQMIEEMSQDTRIKRIIFDLRNNGGGYLGEVSKMLSHFVPENEPVAVVKYIDRNQVLSSRGYETVDLNNYQVIILQNSGTASASEILIGTLKDYYPDITIVGEKSYGKGSVQTTKQYKDGSLLKYTIARWYTGKTQTGIDGIGITPDVEIVFDDEAFRERDFDNQLEEAKKIR